MKLGTHMDNGWMYCVYQNQAAASNSSLYFFIFLSLQVSNVKIFITLFSEALRPARLIVDTEVNSGWMYCVYKN